MKCELCECFASDIADEAVEAVWLHEAFGGPDCCFIGVCQECLDNGVVDGPEKECQQCHDHFTESARKVARENMID